MGGGQVGLQVKSQNRGRKKKYVVLGYHERFPSLKEKKKKWKLEIWQSGKITRDLLSLTWLQWQGERVLKGERGIFVDGVKAVWHDDVISSKMRENYVGRRKAIQLR